MPDTFRRQLEKDIATMMDPAIFGRTVDVDGVPLLIVPWAATDIEKANRIAAGLVGDMQRLVFRATDLDAVNGPPVRGMEVFLDGEPWIVEAVDRQLGFVIVDFYRDRG